MRHQTRKQGKNQPKGKTAMNSQPNQGKRTFTPYLTAIGAWALAFGSSVGWGSFVMPGNTFLPLAGPVGSALGLGLGAIVILIIAANYHFLMNRYPDAGGTYTYTKKSFGYDHGFLSAWFLILTYVAIIWANATALPLIARTLLGNVFQYGFHYEIAGYHVYMGELILAIGALVLGALVCLRRKAAERTQIVMAILLFAGVVICFVAAATRPGAAPMEPAFSPQQTPLGGTITVFALAPWAYVGFESIAHSAGEAKFNLKRSFRIMALALIAAGIAYAVLNLLAVTALPEGVSSWTEYTDKLGEQQGLASQPTFFGAFSALGTTGSVILGVAALCGIFTGLIGNYIALSRLLTSLADDKMLPGKIGETDRNQVPRKAILCILAVSVVLPFFGRTAISWIVDVTTVGATIAYAFASAAAWKEARGQKKKLFMVTGVTGMIVSLLFALEFLVPNIVSIKTLATESYLILAAWGILGFVVFRMILKRDTDKRLGRSTIAWVVLLGLIIFTSSVWMHQTTNAAIEKSAASMQGYYTAELEKAGVDIVSGATRPVGEYLREGMRPVDRTLGATIVIQIVLIIGALLILFDIYTHTQRRERKTEVEKAVAEDASRAKTSFLSNMSHEIRTPMNAIIGLDNIALRNPDLQPETREQLEKIGASAKHLLGVINDILDMSRIESGRMTLKSEEFAFRELLEQVNIMIHGQCADKGITYECKVPEKMRDYYVGDDMKLKQVLINILGNAVKFTDAPGRVILTVEETGADLETCTLRFKIKDTGIGMDPEFIPKIFDSFAQEHDTRTNHYGGSGLGMAITRNLVVMMNGDIQVESQKGVGTEITVTVTLGRSERVYDEKAETPQETNKHLLIGRRILIAEDVEENAEILADLLELEDMESDRAENGEVAVRMFAEQPEEWYDAILMDLRMPVMDGLEAAAAIRAMEREDAKRIPIIALTANAFDEDVQRSLQAGMNAHLSKPIDSDHLLRVLGEMVYQAEEE